MSAVNRQTRRPALPGLLAGLVAEPSPPFRPHSPSRSTHARTLIGTIIYTSALTHPRRFISGVRDETVDG
jgi:hypothetical protein